MPQVSIISEGLKICLQQKESSRLENVTLDSLGYVFPDAAAHVGGINSLMFQVLKTPEI